MNLSKKQFKKQYSEYRKKLKNSFYLGKDAFSEVLNSNSIFRDILVKLERPVSVKVWIHKNN